MYRAGAPHTMRRTLLSLSLLALFAASCRRPDRARVARAWRWENPRPTAMSFSGACTSNDGSLIAVGDVGTLLRRRAGRWTRVETGLADALDAVGCCPDGRIIAAGAAGVVLTLAQGSITRTSLEAPVRAVHCAPDNTVVLADAAQRVHVQPPGARDFVTVAAPERFVSLARVGAHWFAGGSSGRLFRAVDPRQGWTVAASAARPILSVAGAGSTVLAVGSQGVALRSTDGGQRWSLAEVGRGEDWLFAHHDGAHFRIVGTGGHALRSQDAITWTVEAGDLSERVRSIARDGAPLVAVGGNG